MPMRVLHLEEFCFLGLTKAFSPMAGKTVRPPAPYLDSPLCHTFLRHSYAQGVAPYREPWHTPSATTLVREVRQMALGVDNQRLYWQDKSPSGVEDVALVDFRPRLGGVPVSLCLLEDGKYAITIIRVFANFFSASWWDCTDVMPQEMSRFHLLTPAARRTAMRLGYTGTYTRYWQSLEAAKSDIEQDIAKGRAAALEKKGIEKKNWGVTIVAIACILFILYVAYMMIGGSLHCIFVDSGACTVGSGCLPGRC